MDKTITREADDRFRLVALIVAVSAILGLSALPAYWRLLPTDGLEVSRGPRRKVSESATSSILEQNNSLGEEGAG